MSRQHHRGPHPEDGKLFAPREIARLRAACEEVSWLLGRGYPQDVAVAVAGNHHQLDARQRLAVQRAAASEPQRAARLMRALTADDVAGRALVIDGFNLVITLEVALGGGVLIAGVDGCLRDLAGLRGSYHIVDETDAALQHTAAAFAALAPARATFYLDAVVSNSGRLRALLLDHARHAWPCPVTVELVPDADPVLAASPDVVVTADSVILDRCGPWFNLTAWILRERLPGTQPIALGDLPGRHGAS